MALASGLVRKLILFAASASVIGCASGDPTGTEQTPPPTVPEGAIPVVEAVRITDKDQTSVSGELAQSSLEYVRNYDPELGISDMDEFEIQQVREGKNQLTHVRMNQMHEGLKVWGAGIVVHSRDHRFLGLSGTLAKHLGQINANPKISADQALSIGRDAYSSRLKSAAASDELAFSRESTELVVYPGEGRNARVAWHVVFFTELQAGLNPGLWNYFVDAKSGEIIAQFNAIHTLEQASGPGGNPKVARTWNAELDVEPQGAQFAMNTARLVTGNMNNGTSGSGTIVVGPLANIGDAPINDAHGFAEQTLNMLTEWYGHNSIDDNGFVIRSRVHYDTNYENAFWDGTQMTYGDGASTFYPLSGDIDVVAHEIDHGFTTFHSDLIYSSQSGGMNESFSDIAGTIAEFFDEGEAADMDLGTDIFRADAALRFMCDPTADGASIDNFEDYVEGIDVHFSSGIQNKMFCRFARRLATGDPDGEETQASIRRAGEVMYEANASFWTADSTFEQGCDGTIQAATALGFSADEIAALNTSWQDVGVFCDGTTPPITCDETLTGETGTVSSPNFPANYPNNFRRTYCIQPASGGTATLTFSAFNTEAGFDFVRIRDASGAQVSNTSGTTAPAPASSTQLAITFTSDGSVVATGWSASWTTGGGGENQAPTVDITSPTDGDVVSGTVAIAASAADADGTVDHVTFTLPDGTTVDDASAPYEASWDSTTTADGVVEIGAQAVDNLGAASAAVSVAVEVANGGGGECVGGTFSATDVPIAIPDNNAAGITSTVAVAGDGAVGTLALSLNIDHTWRGDLRVVLVSPSGTQAVVHNRTGGSADDLVINALDVAAFAGETAAGNWQLKVSDLAGLDVGSLLSWSMDIVGDCDGGGGGGWSGSATPNLATVDNGSACTSLTVTGSGDGSGALLSIAGQHDWRSILRGTLAHNGTTVDAFPAGTFPSQPGAFSFTDRAVAGLAGSAAGEWTLCIVDTDAFGDTGVLNSWSVHN